MAESCNFGKLLNTFVINFSMLDRQEEKISRSLMTICNIFCFGQPDNSFWGGI